MSWTEQEAGASAVAENPEPEDEADLPQWQPQRDVRAQASGEAEEDGPEEDAALSQPAEGTADFGEGNGRQPVRINNDEVGNGHVQGVDGGNAEGVSVSEQNSRMEGDVVGGGAAAGQDRDTEVGDVGATAEEGDSFEQDEELAAPECETGLRDVSCSESDRQLLLAVNETGVESSQNVSPAHVEAEEAEANQPNGGGDIAVINQEPEDNVANRREQSQALAESESSSRQFSGDIQVVNNLDDAPEAELDGLGGEMVVEACEEDAVVADPTAEVAEPAAEGAQLCDVRAGETSESSSACNVGGHLAKEDSEPELQVPECDREVQTQQDSPDRGDADLPEVRQAENQNVSAPISASAHEEQHSHDLQSSNIANGLDQSLSESEVQSVGENGGAEGSEVHSLSRESPPEEQESFPSGDAHAVICHPENVAGEVRPEATSASGEGGSETSLKGCPNTSPSEPIQESHSDSPVAPQGEINSAMPQARNSADGEDVPLSTVFKSSQPASASEKNITAPPVNSQTSASVKTSQHDSNVQNDRAVEQQSPSPSAKANASSSLSDLSSGISDPPTPSRQAPSTGSDSDSDSYQRKLARALQIDDDEDDDDDILSQLDAALLSRSPISRPKISKGAGAVHRSAPQRSPPELLNGVQPSFELKQLQTHNRQLLEQLKIRDAEINRLTQERNTSREELSMVTSERDKMRSQQSSSPGHNADDVYLPQIKEMEKTIAQLQTELKATKEKLVSHDTAAKRAVTTLQNELKARVDQVTKQYEDCQREKDMMVVRFAEAEAKTLESRRMVEKWETKIKDAIREKENMAGAVKTAKADRQKAMSSYDAKCHEVSNLLKELEKLKEATSSAEYRIKWFQNKLKDELDSHKETKGNLEKTTSKLKEAREETEVIRLECQAIVKRYQESEEIKSNSLDKELKMKESELKMQMQERTDTEEIHQMTKRELDSLKGQHKDTLEEAKTLKDKVHCLEEERQQNHQMIERYQEIMQRQKGDNVDLKAKVTSMSTLQEDYDRAQDMIKSLDKDVAEFKVSNRDLQKDMELCRERESKMLTLQSELSRTNALLRSENTSLNNKASTLTGEVEKLKMEIQELETTVKDLSDKYEEEKMKRKEEIDKLTAALSERSKESSDFKQKWEDEVDSSKTLKRRHANNVKDLTRQLQQVRRKLEAMEGKGDAGSMGSRTNSNGSLNSIDAVNSQAPHPPPQPSVQEFPVITEQVEVDKQVLIERIVRLQKSHARKNEKLEFLGEHIQQLLEEIKRKNKIIQSYVLREEAGTLSSEDMDANKDTVNKAYKTLLSRKGGIMASVYSLHQQDGNMTLELSLQINRKLQAVLEDTLLKNITLKENLDTLGEEIARLSQQNRKLQLHLQDLEKR
ncbi:coiled-coil domain-containing protein 186 isoform X2 [Aplysia californica]|uniref:Coiled-coil domain-containing protein 186 isoform X2 n=1 Tax=Aplysia californica TaxID=6500 RepID=A0ABM0JV81_APLCA|nr:coiled-coil domain-containing protein 186 isoform X2 [Aplysia californica]